MEWCGVGEEMERSVLAVRSRAVFTRPRITISIYEIPDIYIYVHVVFNFGHIDHLLSSICFTHRINIKVL